ncbi:MAG: N-acetylglucosamine-6-phosphate deacetylase [Anaerolineales bacterium]|nr:MAG: N-acetylglucosamine-6-phosphate deacetylase [Anaerolineales bacterium]
MPTTLYDATVFTPKDVMRRASIVVSDDGRIAYVGPMEDAPRADGPHIDMRGRIVVPGFVDVHVHGGHGIRFGTPGDRAADLRAYSEWVASTGVTGFLCSISAPDPQSLVQMVSDLADVLDADMPGGEALGLHLEGPFINKEKKGAFNPAWLRKPAMEETEAVLDAGRGWIRQVSLAPELPGAHEVAARFRAAGVVVSMGHTNADYATASAALRGNFTHITHTFNAQRGFHHREPGVFGAIMASDEVTAELIADTVHVHPGAMKMLIRCLGSDRVVLITDAMAAAGLSDGEYGVVGQAVTVKDGQARLADGTLAGSTATLDGCVRNVTQQVGFPLLEAVKMASLNPARAMGFADRLGSLAAGKDASLAVIDEQVNVYLTMVKGRIVFQAW